MATKVFGYARVSTKDQNAARQIDELRKYVREENIYIDRKSGADFNRREYQRLKEIVRSGDEIFVKSLDRLGRNKQMIKDELAAFKEEGVAVHILDLPQTMLPAANKAQRQIFEMVTNILIEVMGYIAEEEREAIRSRQAEGIAAWRRTGITKTGRPYGRPRKEKPANWDKVYGLWKEKQIKTSEARVLLGNMGKNLFYRFVHEMEEVQWQTKRNRNKKQNN